MKIKVKSIIDDLDINGLSPRNRWTNGKNKPRAGAIFENVCKS